jgi:hypothetical protein
MSDAATVHIVMSQWPIWESPVRPFLLAVHIAAGGAGLLLGPLAMALPKRPGWHPRVGRAYQVAVALLTTSAVGLVVLEPALWWLALIGAATEAAALAGWAVRRRARPGWRPLHLRLMCGSYVSLVTAFLVVNVSSPLVWVLPTIVATPLISLAAKRAARPSRPSMGSVA